MRRSVAVGTTLGAGSPQVETLSKVTPHGAEDSHSALTARSPGGRRGGGRCGPASRLRSVRGGGGVRPGWRRPGTATRAGGPQPGNGPQPVGGPGGGRCGPASRLRSVRGGGGVRPGWRRPGTATRAGGPQPGEWTAAGRWTRRREPAWVMAAELRPLGVPDLAVSAWRRSWQSRPHSRRGAPGCRRGGGRCAPASRLRSVRGGGGVRPGWRRPGTATRACGPHLGRWTASLAGWTALGRMDRLGRWTALADGPHLGGGTAVGRVDPGTAAREGPRE